MWLHVLWYARQRRFGRILIVAWLVFFIATALFFLFTRVLWIPGPPELLICGLILVFSTFGYAIALAIRELQKRIAFRRGK